MDDTEAETAKAVKEILVVQDEGLFEHDTGDTYNGFFEAKKKDRSVKMHGVGVYTTKEGDTYAGTWDSDKLGANEDVTITYTDGSKYVGHFKEWSYHGHGRYYYPDNSYIEAEFIDNLPVGSMTLHDPNGHLWFGHAEQGYAWFEPFNHYYYTIDKYRESKKVNRKSDV